MDVIQEIDKVINDVAGMASTTEMLPTSPPQHPFATGTSVEQVINKLETLKYNVWNDKSSYDQSHCYFNIPKINSNSLSIKELVAFVQSYVKSQGVCTADFIQKLYDFIDEVDKTICRYQSNMLEASNTKTENKFQKIIERIKQHS